MVYGLDKFKEYFKEHTNQYVFIGGTACDILMDELGVPFRTTKDLDIVLIIEALDASFGDKFWQFIEDGGYELKEKNTGEEQFYRFTKPTKSGYPKMIELFSRKSEQFELKFESGLTPIHIGDSIISLSAILLEDVYYDILTLNKKIVDGFSVIEIEAVILFKMKAWLDLKERQSKGEKVDSKDIRKHKNDIFRLLATVLPSSRVEVDIQIKDDIRLFIEKINQDQPDLKNLGFKNTNLDEIVGLLKNIYF